MAQQLQNMRNKMRDRADPLNSSLASIEIDVHAAFPLVPTCSCSLLRHLSLLHPSWARIWDKVL